MTTAQTPSDVERLARGLEEGFCGHAAWLQPAAAELRRLQAENERLRGDYALRGAQIQRMADLIDELEARKPLPLSDWINADERRPEASLDVLVVIDGKWVTTGEWLHAQKTWCWEQTGDEPDESRVTHWMHMPSPPAHGITGGS